MKCPNCGFVTFPDPTECKKCGHRFAPEHRGAQPSARSITFRSPERSFTLSPPESAPLNLAPPETANVQFEAVLPSSQPEMPADPGQPRAHEEQQPDWTAAGQTRTANPWHDEIAARVARYRRRRNREGDAEASGASLQFDFDDLDRARDRATPKAGETELKPTSRDGDLVELDLEASGEVSRREVVHEHQEVPDPNEDPAEWALAPLNFHRDERPVEIVLHSGEPEADIEESADAAPSVAPLGRRITAGMVDTLVLLLAGAAFFLLFRASGGRIDRQPASLAVIGFIFAFLVAFYFSVFTALAFATPGQSAVGLRVQTLQGDRPDVRASLWRGTGYLVSAVSLMLGFVWAVFDPDHLTWHDRMSRTCLVERG